MQDEWELINQGKAEKSGRVGRILPDRVSEYRRQKKKKLGHAFPLRILAFVNISISFSPLGGT